MRGRFAPSPTGELHFGGARTALVACLDARSRRAAFVMRVEDLDGPRTVAGAETRILEDLAWLGLDWDEGPYRQSERTALYQAALERLRAEGRAYPCYCSRAEIQRAATAPHGPSDDGPVYPGTCRDGAVPKDRAPAWRFRVDDGAVDWVDVVAGPQHDDVAAQVGDFVIARADGVFAYQLAVVVDDGAMGITDVVRGDDLRASTARQILLHRALAQTPPERWLHVPLVLGPDGARLSKRHGAIALRRWRDQGLSAAAARGRLASTLGLCAPDAAPSLAELLATYDVGRIAKTPTTLSGDDVSV